MYRHGLGDCFLLSFPRGRQKDFHLMIDCGIVLGTSDPGKVMNLVAEDIKKATGGTLDVLVITHEHWDHLSGFDENQARSVFASMKIKDLWLAWTEDPTDGLATSLRDERERKKKAAKAAKEAAQKAAKNAPAGRKRALEAQARHITEVLGFFGVAAAGEADADGGDGEEDGGGTQGALNFLKQKCQPTILQTGSSMEVPGLDDVRVYVVGPPKDGAAMRRTNPHKGEGYGLADPPISLADAFLASFDPEDDPENERAQPFEKSMRRSLADLRRLTPQGAAPAAAGKPDVGAAGIHAYYKETSAWRSIDDAWLATGERLALQLDNATNNTSLVLAIELGGVDGDVLLFVGDAQAGNWRSWEARSWEVEVNGKAGKTRRVTSADLLGRTIFYKVGHHGSHNATMREKGLELMKSDRLAAFIPVDTDVAHQVKGWVHMPLPAIRERLEKKCAVVFQSDMAAMEKRKIPGTRWEESPQQFEVYMKDGMTKKTKAVGKRPLYTDYFV